jgi:hypothetical protein
METLRISEGPKTPRREITSLARFAHVLYSAQSIW